MTGTTERTHDECRMPSRLGVRISGQRRVASVVLVDPCVNMIASIERPSRLAGVSGRVCTVAWAVHLDPDTLAATRWQLFRASSLGERPYCMSQRRR